MNSANLRQALDTDGKLIGRDGIEHPFVTAARSWLTLLEADEKTVEKVAAACFDAEHAEVTWGEAKAAYTEEGVFEADSFINDHDYYYKAARAVLAVLVGEET